jgi:hypothetical protein
MMSLKSILSLFMLVACLFTVSFAKKDDDEASGQAARDLQMGMAGLKEAGSNPALLAQLMRDLQVSQECLQNYINVSIVSIPETVWGSCV